MKEFKENYNPETFKLIDVDGNEYEISLKFLTASDFNKIEKMMIGNDSDKKSNTERVVESIIIACGKDEKFWMKFSIELLGELTNYITEELKNKKKRNRG